MLSICSEFIWSTCFKNPFICKIILVPYSCAFVFISFLLTKVTILGDCRLVVGSYFLWIIHLFYCLFLHYYIIINLYYKLVYHKSKIHTMIVESGLYSHCLKIRSNRDLLPYYQRKKPLLHFTSRGPKPGWRAHLEVTSIWLRMASLFSYLILLPFDVTSESLCS